MRFGPGFGKAFFRDGGRVRRVGCRYRLGYEFCWGGAASVELADGERWRMWMWMWMWMWR